MKKQEQDQHLRKEINTRKQPDKKQYIINRIFKNRTKRKKANKKKTKNIIISKNNNKIQPLQRVYKNNTDDVTRTEASPSNFYQYNRPPESRIRTRYEEKIFLKATAYLNIIKNKKQINK